VTRQHVFCCADVASSDNVFSNLKYTVAECGLCEIFISYWYCFISNDNTLFLIYVINGKCTILHREIHFTRGVWKVMRLLILFQGFLRLGYCPSHAVHFLQYPTHFSSICTVPFPDILHRVMAVFCCSCFGIGNDQKSHGDWTVG
jgi:hypothetical protein